MLAILLPHLNKNRRQFVVNASNVHILCSVVVLVRSYKKPFIISTVSNYSSILTKITLYNDIKTYDTKRVWFSYFGAQVESSLHNRS